MQHFNIKNMSAEEYDFIRQYCLATKQQYRLMVRVSHLIDPDNLAISDIITATKIASQLSLLEDECCKKIESCGVVNKKLSKAYTEEVSFKQITNVIIQSFIKVSNKGVKSITKDVGWSSGHPTQWYLVLNSAREIYKYCNNMKSQKNLTGIFGALLKLFTPTKNKSKKKPSKKLQPPKFDKHTDNDWIDEIDDFDDLNHGDD
jgi:hypothetical protein